MAASVIPILTFHSIDEQDAVISFSPDLFARGIAILCQADYRTLCLDAVVDTLNRKLPFPSSTLALTFDDGYASVYQNAFPILTENKMTATIFLTVGDQPADRLPSLNGRAMLSWEEIREMHKYGIEFGAHTLTHPDLTRLPLQNIETEMRASQDRIEQMLGARVSSFAYPFGRFNAPCRAIAQKYFACAVSVRLGWVRQNSDPFALERLDAYYLKNDKLLAALPAAWLRWYILARRVSRDLRRASGAR